MALNSGSIYGRTSPPTYRNGIGPTSENLIPDLVERSKNSPDAVFRQLCDLSAGPLLADETIEIEGSESAIRERFPELQLLTK